MTADKDDTKEYDDPEFGIELDKLEVPDAASISVTTQTIQTPSFEEPEETKPDIDVDIEVDTQRGWRFKLIVIAAVVLVLVTLLLLLKSQTINPLFNLGPDADSAKLSYEYHPLDPIITNFGEDRQVEIYLTIRYRTELKEQNSVIEPLIRDSVLVFLNSPDTQKQVSARDLAKSKPLINNKLSDFLKHDYGDDVILKEIKIH